MLRYTTHQISVAADTQLIRAVGSLAMETRTHITQMERNFQEQFEAWAFMLAF